MLLTSAACLRKFGAAEKENNMILWDVPTSLEYSAIPRKIYCNQTLVRPLERALQAIRDRGLTKEIKTWDGCFNIRKKKGGTSLSLHAWGVAIDLNAAWNGFRKEPTMKKELVQCFTDFNWEWGGHWNTKDGMHFQLKDFTLSF